MLNKVKHLCSDSSLTLRMTSGVNMYIIIFGKDQECKLLVLAV